MHFYVGITDQDWFTELRRTAPHDEVNFWRPSPGNAFRNLKPGELFLFKLHSPQNFVVGGGFFSHYTTLPASLAWRAFGPRNGAQTELEMRARIERYRRIKPAPSEDYEVGCILLQAPFFLAEDDWIPASDWNPSIQQGKGYESEEAPGHFIWSHIEMLLAGERIAPPAEDPDEVEAVRVGAPRTVFPRLGQGSFRIQVLDAYQRRCAFTGSPVLYVLEAGHIKPHAEGGPSNPRNGLLLRQDMHTLFDRGYMTVTPEYRVEVSRGIKGEFENGKEYYSLHGRTILIPSDVSNQPSPDYLRWHNENKFHD
jgi:putative restriction endonuclease